MQTLKTLLLLALLASSDSYRQSRRYKGQSSKGEKEKDEVDNGKEEEKIDNDDKKEEEPRSYKGEKECDDDNDCVRKKLCQAGTHCKCILEKGGFQNLCEEIPVEDWCDDDNDCVKKKICQTGSSCKCHQNVCEKPVDNTCDDVMDCVYKGVCMADGACRCLQNKCEGDGISSYEEDNDDKEEDEVDNGKEEEEKKEDNDDKEEEEPRSYKGEKECEDVMDCVYKGVCMADGACQCLYNKCNTERSKRCEDVNDCIKKKFCQTSKNCGCHQNVCLYFDESRKPKEKCKVVEDCYKKKACSADEACKCLQNKCEAKVQDNCEKDKCCQKTIKSCTKKNPCICVQKLPTPGSHEWFKHSGVCVKKADGCMPGRKLQGNKCSGSWGPEEGECHHKPNDPREDPCL